MASTEPHPIVAHTYREYALLPQDGQRWELIDGDFHVTPAPSPLHQTVSRRLQFALMQQLEERGLALVFDAPIDVLLSETTCVQPDLAIVRTARKHLVTGRAIEGAPDVVVEILSPSTRGVDQLLKKGLYARHGVPEYWLVEPERGSVTLLLQAEGNVYTREARFDRASTLASPQLPEISIPLEPLFRPL